MEIKKYQQLLANKGIAITIESLKETVNQTSVFFYDLIILESRHKDLMKKQYKGIFDDQTILLEENKIRETLLHLINTLKKEDFQPKEIVNQVSNLFSYSSHVDRKNDLNKDRIFLCHASEDKQHVFTVYKKLQTSGFNPWLDKTDLLPGQKWDREIKRVLKSSRIVVVFFSHFSVSKRGYVQRELKLALDTLEEIPNNQIFIIPVRLNNCKIPDEFQHLHYIDLFAEGGSRQLLNVLEKEIGSASHLIDERDGQFYKTIKLASKTWMAENLRFKVKHGCWSYENDLNISKKIGLLYDFDSAIEACPFGWRLPTEDDVKDLIDYFDLINLLIKEKKRIPEIYTQRYESFNVQFGGLRTRMSLKEEDWCFTGLGKTGIFWSILDKGTAGTFVARIEDDNLMSFNHLVGNVGFGLSVRCVKEVQVIRLYSVEEKNIFVIEYNHNKLRFNIKRIKNTIKT